MTEKKIKNSNSSIMPKEDRDLYRLFAVFGAAIMGFAGLRLVNESKLLLFLKVGRWFALAFLLFSIAWPIYIRCIRKIDESGKVFTSVGVSYFLIPVFFILAAYPNFTNANVKFQVAYAIISLFAVIFIIFKKDFTFISAITFVCAGCLYYIQANTYDFWLENILSYLSMVLAYAVPLAVAVVILLAMRSKEGTVSIGTHPIYKLSSKFGGWITLVMCVILILSAALVMIVPAIFSALMIALLIIYVIIGIVCTIKLI